MMNNDSEKLRGYFLGTLAQCDAEEIELRLISDKECEGDLVFAENELVEDSLEGKLTANETRLFRENYAVTPERKKNIEAVMMLRAYAKEHFIKENLPPISKKPSSFFSRLKSGFFTHPVPVFALGLLILIAVFATYIWTRRDQGPYPDSQTKYAELNRKDFNNLKEFERLTTVTAASGISRGEGAIAKIPDGPRSENIFIRLTLPVEFRNYKLFNVGFVKDKTTLLHFDSQRDYGSPSTVDVTELRLLIPSKIFERGIYRIEVAPVDETGNPAVYYFIVE